MKRHIMIAALASAALFAAGPSLAQGHGGGHGGGQGGGHGATGGGHGNSGMGAGAGGMSDMGRTTRDQARSNSRGPDHASDRAIEHANDNSVLSGTATGRAALTGLQTGMVVRDSTGAVIGTVRRVLRSADGRVSNVLVAANGGTRTIPLAPDTLTVSGNAVTTTRLATSRRRR